MWARLACLSAIAGSCPPYKRGRLHVSSIWPQPSCLRCSACLAATCLLATQLHGNISSRPACCTPCALLCMAAAKWRAFARDQAACLLSPVAAERWLAQISLLACLPRSSAYTHSYIFAKQLAAEHLARASRRAMIGQGQARSRHSSVPSCPFLQAHPMLCSIAITTFCIFVLSASVSSISAPIANSASQLTEHHSTRAQPRFEKPKC